MAFLAFLAFSVRAVVLLSLLVVRFAGVLVGLAVAIRVRVLNSSCRGSLAGSRAILLYTCTTNEAPSHPGRALVMLPPALCRDEAAFLAACEDVFLRSVSCRRQRRRGDRRASCPQVRVLRSVPEKPCSCKRTTSIPCEQLLRANLFHNQAAEDRDAGPCWRHPIARSKSAPSWGRADHARQSLGGSPL
jgi:hypothetical protein